MELPTPIMSGARRGLYGKPRTWSRVRSMILLAAGLPVSGITIPVKDSQYGGYVFPDGIKDAVWEPADQ